MDDDNNLKEEIKKLEAELAEIKADEADDTWTEKVSMSPRLGSDVGIFALRSRPRKGIGAATLMRARTLCWNVGRTSVCGRKRGLGPRI